MVKAHFLQTTHLRCGHNIYTELLKCFSFSALILRLQLMINFVFHQSKLRLYRQSVLSPFFSLNIDNVLIFQDIVSKLELQVR